MGNLLMGGQSDPVAYTEPVSLISGGDERITIDRRFISGGVQ